MSCAKCKPTVLPVCDALSEKLDVMFAAKPLPNECGVSRVGWLEQLDRIIDIWRLIAVAVQNHVKTVPPFAVGVAGFRGRRGIGNCWTRATDEDALLMNHRQAAAAVEQRLQVFGMSR